MSVCVWTDVQRVWHDDPEGGDPLPLTFGMWFGHVDGIEYGNSVLITGHSITEDEVRRMLLENAREAGVNCVSF